MKRREQPDQTSNAACSFCRKTARDVRKLIAGPSVTICDECVEVCVDILRDSKGTDPQDLEVMRAEPRAPLWPARGTTVYCNLCRLPFPLDEALLVEAKGVLCLPCVSQVQALSTEGALQDKPGS